MNISFVDIFGNKKAISSEEVTYLIPYSGKLIANDVIPNTCIVNHKPINDSSFEVTIEQKDITLSCKTETYRIKILSGQLSQESIIDYQNIYKQYLSYTKEGCISYQDLRDAFDSNNKNAIKLCSFNKKFANLLQSSNRDEILKDVKFLPHIFYKPKLHLKQVEEVRLASIVTRIGTESIRHLASHSEHWKGIKANGLVPERLLARILEDDYAIYENVAAKTIVDKLYALEKKEKEDTIDCKMNFSLSESYSQGGERQNFFDAINFLFKGFENSESSTTQKLIDEILEVINSILKYLSKCKSTNLYRNIKKEKEIKGALKKTNIFMMDNYYKKVYELWKILGRKEKITELTEVKELKEEYLLYVELIVLFCLDYMGFKPENESESLLTNNLFDNCCFVFNDWKIVLNTEKAKLFDGFITAELSQKKQIPICFNIELPNSDIYSHFNALKDNNKIIFEKKLDEKELVELCNQLSNFIEKNKQVKWKQDFKRIIFDKMKKITYKTEKVLFIPWKYGIADDYKIATETLKAIQKLIPAGFDEYYILNITRPNELRTVNDEKLLNSLVSYSLKNQESKKENKFGIIPVTLNDINSFRRLSKIFMKNMITVKDEQNYCLQCGSKMRGDKSQGYFCINQTCGFEIYNSQCQVCKKKYWYTNYTFPKVFQLDSESLGMKILLNENDLGFKNITVLTVDHKPECPYCNNGSTLSFEGKYTTANFIISSKNKQIRKELKVSQSITTNDAPKKNLIRETINFVKPSEHDKLQVTTEKKSEFLSNKEQMHIANQALKIKNIAVKSETDEKTSKSIRCPCCNKALNKNNYLIHLNAHSENKSYKILSKTLVGIDTVLCPICLYEFNKKQSFDFIQHIENDHEKGFTDNFKIINGMVRCKKCDSILSGVHPSIIVQHFLGGCKSLY